MWIKDTPNQHEVYLYERAQKYIRHLSWIPGIRMIAIVNSLSMYATHKDSDIDLFIVCEPWMIYFVRLFSTFILWKKWVWRKGDAIRENFCLSFFITSQSPDLSEIALENDIYLYYWIYYMKPIYEKNDTYLDFLQANSWVEVDSEQLQKNNKYLQESSTKYKYSTMSPYSLQFFKYLNTLIRFFVHPYTQRSYRKLWMPSGVIISDSILKFHNSDRRQKVRDAILEKNFDK